METENNEFFGAPKGQTHGIFAIVFLNVKEVFMIPSVKQILPVKAALERQFYEIFDIRFKTKI